MRRKKAMKWMALVPLVLLLAVASTGMADEPEAVQPSEIACGDSITCNMGSTAMQVVNNGAAPAIFGRNNAGKAGIRGRGVPGVYGYSWGGAGVVGESEWSYGLRAVSANSNAVHATSNGAAAVYAENTTGGNALFLDGHAAQTLQSNGLVKAGVVGWCAWIPGGVCVITRSFNNVGGTITVAAGASGQFTVDLGFDVSQRFWAPTLTSPPTKNIGCALGGTNTQLICEVDYNIFNFMLLVY